jgi:4-nitrophenyl phosphatase
MAIDWRSVEAVMCDMDGVLWLDDVPLRGLEAFFERLRARSVSFQLATNNSSKTPADYVDKLARMGVQGVLPDHIITSGTVTISALLDAYPPGTTAHVVGGAGLRALMAQAGFTLTDGDAAFVVVGLDPALTYDRLKRAAFCLGTGAAFYATNDDAAIPTPEGLAPGAGSIVAALMTATGRTPTVMGKPHRPMFAQALERMGIPADRALMIGDRLETDIAGGKAVGMQTALLLSGASAPAHLDAAAAQPDAIFDDLAHLVRDWDQAFQG